MPTAVLDPFGNTIQACSISTMVKAKFNKDYYGSEAAWSKHVKADAFNTLRTKILNSEVPLNTVVGRTADGGKLVYKKIHDVPSVEISFKGIQTKLYSPLEDFDTHHLFGAHDWDFGPNMAKMAQAEKLVVNTPAKLEEWLNKHDNEMDIGDTVATVKPKDYGDPMKVKYDDFDSDGKPQFKMDGPYGTELMDIDGLGYYHKSNLYDVEYKVGQTPDLPPAGGLPVSSTSTSKGALTNEDAATMFVKTKDKLAQEAGINIKGASGKLDDLVYKTIADQAGYTPAEMLMKVEAYKASGKKLSALKKKVLPKSGDATKAPTQKAVDNATAAIKKEELKPEEVVLVWDDEAVAKAYIKAKDHVVATNDNGWTLYTKNDQFDNEINKWMQADLGPIKKETADTAIANYIANTQKLSVLKKQMIKKGELVPKADTLKTSGGKKAAVNSPEELHDLMKKGDTDPGTLVAEMTDSVGDKYQITYTGQNAFGFPLYEFKYPSGYVQKMTQSELTDLTKGGEYKTEYKFGKPKPAPGETGAGQVGKTTQDPKKVGPKQQLTAEQEHDVFLQWEGLNLPISSSGGKIYSEAKSLAQKYNLGDDVLPILQAVDKGKTAKFGLSPEQNKKLYEVKVVEHLKNPHAPAYTPPAAAPVMEAKVFGELPADNDLFKPVSPSEMHDIAIRGMKKPTPQESNHLRIYSGSTYHEINGHMRQGRSVASNPYAKNIQASMSPLPENIISRRGTSLSGLGMQTQEQLTQSIGKTFVEPGFSSTAVGGSGQFSGQVNLVIQAPKGTMAVWLKPHSSIQGENELLLAAGTKFKILKVEQKPGNWGSMTNVVTVRVVP